MSVKVQEIITLIETVAPLSLQEEYDNAGLIIGNANMDVTGALICLDVNEQIIEEAIKLNYNLIISHHPLIFKGLKKINGKNSTENCVILAIRNNLAIYAAHTNLDNVLVNGVNAALADKLHLSKRSVLRPADKKLMKIICFVPEMHAAAVRNALCEAGAGKIGNYDSCSYNSMGYGTFKALEHANPFVGEKNKIHTENEIRMELIFHSYQKANIIRALYNAHPYEEPAFDIISLENTSDSIGSGLMGEFENEMEISDFLNLLKTSLNASLLRFSPGNSKQIRRVALCGGSGSFLIHDAISAKVDAFITGDLKYHDFTETSGKILLVDPGHFETEQFTKDIFYDIIRKKMPKFAVRISEICTNPIKYW
jgi:dinuclear metal center YbgI/SA1388 family protein